MDFATLPKGNFTLKNVTIPAAVMDQQGDLIRTDIAIADGQIATAAGGEIIDMKDAMVLPTFVDCHTHLDKGHILPRAQNPDGTFLGALTNVRGDHANWTPEDVKTRADFSIRTAYAHGTRAIRTHVDSMNGQYARSWPVMDDLRAKWAGRVDLQMASLIACDRFDEPEYAQIADTVATYGGALGMVTYPLPDLKRILLGHLEAAGQRGLSIDFHADETMDPESETLRLIAECILETGFDAPVLAGHCCSLSTQDEARALDTLDLIAKAGIDVVSLPMCNMYLQDRHEARTPRGRGVTLAHEMKARGISVSFASDNTRDPFYAYGDMDMLEVMREATRIAHLDHADPDWPLSFAATPAEVCDFAPTSMTAGSPADLVIFNARNWSELFSRPQMDRIVLRGGTAIDRTLPHYSELDPLFEVPRMTLPANVAAAKAALSHLDVETKDTAIQSASRDFFWYSPVLKVRMDHLVADFVVRPRNEAEIIEILKTCYAHDVPVTTRGAGTGNYGQAMPMRGGCVMHLRHMDKVTHCEPGRVIVEPGCLLKDVDAHCIAACGHELRMFSSTWATATVGGFIAGGSGGVGSVTWGSLRELGNIIRLRVVTMEAESRVLEFTGEELARVSHAYGTNGIITELELPLAPAYDWVGCFVTAKDFDRAMECAENLANENGVLLKIASVYEAPTAKAYFQRVAPYVEDNDHLIGLMVAPHSMEGFLTWMGRNADLKLIYRSDDHDWARDPGLVFEYGWNHTTLRALKVDPSITYLQVRYGFPDHFRLVNEMRAAFPDELIQHLEAIRMDGGKVGFAGLTLVKFTTEERLDEIVKAHEDAGAMVFNPHRYTLEEGGRQHADPTQLSFKKEADPKGLLNPGKMIAWDDPDWDYATMYAYPDMDKAPEEA